MKIFALILTLALSGCATPPQWLATMYDNNDPCQLQNNHGKYPSHCGSRGGVVTRDWTTNRPVYISK